MNPSEIVDFVVKVVGFANISPLKKKERGTLKNCTSFWLDPPSVKALFLFKCSCLKFDSQAWEKTRICYLHINAAGFITLLINE